MEQQKDQQTEIHISSSKMTHEDQPDGCRQLLQGEQQSALSIKHETPTELVSINHGIIEGNYMCAAGDRTTDSFHPSIVKTGPAAVGLLDSKDNIIVGSNDCVNRDVEPTQTITWIPPRICKQREGNSETYVEKDSITAIWVAQPATEEKHQSMIYPMEHSPKAEQELVISSYCSLAQENGPVNEFKVEGSLMDGNHIDVKVEKTKVKKACTDEFIKIEVMDQGDQVEPEQVCAANPDITVGNSDGSGMGPVRPEVYIDVDMVHVETVTDTDVRKPAHVENNRIRTRRCYVMLERSKFADQLVKASIVEANVETKGTSSDSRGKRKRNYKQSERPNKKTRHRCRVCDKCFQYPSRLEVHMRMHTGTKPFQCPVCDRYFSRNDHLTTHMRIHSGERPYECLVCNKYFSHSHHLTTHMRIHSGVRPYKCKVCGKSFASSSCLAIHTLSHTGSKPYQCIVCGKSFTNGGNLTKHTRIHTAEKPYECSLCSKSFSQSNNLIRHKRIHTGDKPFECSVCQKRFVQRCDLIRHMKQHK